MSKKEVSYSPNPCLVEDSILEIRSALEQNCSWLEKSYPLAFIGEVLKGENVHQFPRVYLNDGSTKYLDVMPDKKLKAFSFFELNGDYDIDRVNEEVTSTISIVFWANLKCIDDRDYDYKTELIQDALRCLNVSSIACDITNIAVTENFEEIFNKYSYDQKDMQFFMYPYTSWKFTFSVTQDLNMSCCTEFSTEDCTEIVLPYNFSFDFQVNDPTTINNPLRIDITAPNTTLWNWGDNTSDTLPSIGNPFNKIYSSTGDYMVNASIDNPENVSNLLIRGFSSGTVINELDLSIFTGLSIISLDDLEGISNLILPIMNVETQFSLTYSDGIVSIDDFSKLNFNYNNSNIFMIETLKTESLVNQFYTELDSVTTTGFTGRSIFMQGNTAPTGLGLTARNNLQSKGIAIIT